MQSPSETGSPRKMFRTLAFILVVCTGCAAPEPVIDEQMLRVDAEFPANFDGNWQRDYVRGDEVNVVLNKVLYELRTSTPDGQYSRGPGGGSMGLSPQKMDAMIAIARLAELITRPDTLSITQTDNEISVARIEDFAIFCGFYDGVAKPTTTPYGQEICGWDDENLIAHLQLPDGLTVTHRFTVSEDENQLRIITTVNSRTSPRPFSLSRYYRRYEPSESEFRCVETLSKKRVCGTGDLGL